jgi:tripartite tricarboxylate transporter TctB family protein
VRARERTDRSPIGPFHELSRIPDAVIILLLGAAGLIASIQLDRQLQPLHVSAAIGPARYTAVVSAIILVSGVLLVVQELRRRPPAHPEFVGRLVSPRGVLLILVLLAYVAVVPLVGFTLGNVVFFPLLFQVCGLRPWKKSLVSGLAMSVAFYVVFVWLARIPIPKGWLGL